MPSGVYPRKASKPLAERLFDRSIPVPEAGCWLFEGCLNHAGYGDITVSTGRHVLAHRASYEAFVCEIPDGMKVLHRCDTPSCINPDHLYLGDQAQNMRDAAERNRVQRGTAKWNARLTPSLVREIRASAEDCGQMSRRLGVSPMTILDVRHNRTWKHVV